MKMRKHLEIVSDKKKRVQSRACAHTRHTNRKFRSKERLVGSLPLANYTSVHLSFSPAKAYIYSLHAHAFMTSKRLKGKDVGMGL